MAVPHIFVAGTTAESAKVNADFLSLVDGTAFDPLIIDNSHIKANAAIAFSKLAALASGNIIVGSAGNVATSVAMTGDVTISNTGLTAITGLCIVNGDIANATITYAKLNLSNGDIPFVKLATLTSAHILVGSAGNVATDVAVTGDIGITNAGVTSITAGAIVNNDVNAGAAIVASKLDLSPTSQDVLIDDTYKLLLGTGGDGEIYSSGDELFICNITSNKDIIFQINDGGTAREMIRFISTTPGVYINYNGGAGIDGRLAVFDGGGGNNFGLNYDGDAVLTNTNSDGDIYIKGSDGGVVKNFLVFDCSVPSIYIGYDDACSLRFFDGGTSNHTRVYQDTDFNIYNTVNGSDTYLQITGAGYIKFGTYAAGALAVAGSISIKDSAGNIRRLLVG